MIDFTGFSWASQFRWVGYLITIGFGAHFLAVGAGELLSMAFLNPAEEGTTARSAPLPSPRRSDKQPFRARSSDVICEKNIFNFSKRPCIESNISQLEPTKNIHEPAVPPLCKGETHLVGTVASKREEWSFAMIEREGKALPYRVGDEVEDLGEVERIGWRFVLFAREQDTDCLLDVFTKGEPRHRTRRGRTNQRRRNRSKRRNRRSNRRTQLQKELNENINIVSPTERNVARSYVEKIMENPTTLMRSVRVRPYQRSGQFVGFKLYGIRRNSLLSRLGLRNGDIVQSINGNDITSADQALAVYAKMRSADRITVTVRRRGHPVNYDFSIR